MKPTGLWLSRLAMAASCLVWAGCGGSDVPDPSSDSNAAVETPAKIVDQGAASAEAPSEPTPPAAPAAPQPRAEARTESAPAPKPEVAENPPTPTSTESAPAATESATASTSDGASSPLKGDASGTDEMLRMTAAAPAPAPADAPAAGTPADAKAPAPAPGSPGGSGLAGMTDAPSPNAAARRGGGGNQPAAEVAPDAGRSNGGGGADRAGMKLGDEGGRPSFGSGPTPGSANGSDRDAGPEAFRTPGTAVQAFLKALTSKNKDRLAQATARRAARESAEKHQKIFAAILEGSISDEELDDMAKSFEGFQVMSILPAKSTGQIGVVIGKMESRDRLQRTVQVRHEKEGWKVLDILGVIDFKPVGTYRNPYGRRR